MPELFFARTSTPFVKLLPSLQHFPIPYNRISDKMWDDFLIWIKEFRIKVIKVDCGI